MAAGRAWVLGAVGACCAGSVLFALAGEVEFEPLAAVHAAGSGRNGGASEGLELLRTDASAPSQPAEEFAADPAAEDRPPPTLQQVDAWVLALCDDGIPRNALEALWQLDFAGRTAVAPLEAALGSWDAQQRHLAAVALRRIGADPTPRLVEVSVEALRGEWNRPWIGTLLAAPAAGAVRWLAQHPAAAQAALRRALGSDDPQQRFLAAFLLATGGSGVDQGYVVRELVEHLADNEIEGDAVMACHGLYRLGPPVLPALRSWRPHVDEQARQLIDLVELNLLQPPATEQDFVHRQSMHRATNVYRDPSLHYDVRRSRVPTW